MNLTPEQKQIGKDNFHQVVGSTRRDFLKSAGLASVVTGASAGAMWFGYGQSVAQPVRIGIIGTGDEGGVLIGALNPNYVQVVAIADIRPYNRHRAFHGDASSPGTLIARPGLMSVYGWRTETEARRQVTVYEDGYDELLDDPQVEAVIVALPLHIHDEAAIKAMRKGKHVLTEKLMAHSVHQCKEMARVAQQTGQLLATGHQRHYNVLYDNAVDTIKRDLIGDIHYIRAQWHRGNLPGRDSWSPPLPTEIMSADEFVALRRKIRAESGVAAERQLRLENKLLDQLVSWTDRLKKARGKQIDFLQKQVAQKKQQIEDLHVNAERYGYQEKTLDDGQGTIRSALEELIRWRLWNRTGGGLMAELGSHQLDAASIFISSQRDDGKKVLPLSVTAVGGRHLFPPDRDVDDHVYCTYEFPGKGYFEDFESKRIEDANKKIVVTYSSINGNGFGGYGETVMGTKGTLILEREKDVMLYAGSNTATRVTVNEKQNALVDTYETGGGAAAATAQAAIGADVSRGYREEIEHWAWCVRNPDPENQPKCHPQVALADAVIALTSNTAMRTQSRIEFQHEWFDIDNDATPEGVKPRQADQV